MPVSTRQRRRMAMDSANFLNGGRRTRSSITTTTVSSGSTTPTTTSASDTTTQMLAVTPMQAESNQDDVVSPEMTPSPKRTRKRKATTKTATTKLTNKKKKNKGEPRVEGEDDEKITLATKKPSPSRRKKTKAKKKEIPAPGSKAPPKDFEKIYALVEELRKDRSAPVDSNGGEALPQRDRGEKVFRFQVLMALMLSSQTKDNVVGDAIRALQKHGLDIGTIQKTPPDVLNRLIAKVGFHNNKTKYIKQSVEMLLQDYEGDIPKTAQDIMKLPGVGPKMAYIVENVAWGTMSGIGIDTHMHRMFNELRWVNNTKNPEQTRIELESWLPRDKWATVNRLWVGFGQEVQQFKPKLLRKALDCSDPPAALRLIKRLGLDYKKEAEKLGLEDEVKAALK